MTQRRMPSGQGPARRPGPGAQSGRLRSTARSSGRAEPVREPGARTPSTARRSDSPRVAGSRSANRPAAARRAAAAGAATRTQAPQPRRLTGRAAVLSAVLVALALAYTYPIREYLTTQSDIAEMEAAQQAQRERIERLSDQAALWRDPDYIRIEAKRRFFMVYPGEELLIVLSDPAGAARDAGLPPPDAAVEPDPWYDTLWSSVEAANAESAG